MNTTGKNNQLLQFSRKLSYSQAIVFSDEGNLTSLSKFDNDEQDKKWSRKPNGLWFSHGSSWVNFLKPDDPTERHWSIKRLGIITHIYRIYLSPSVLRIRTKMDMNDFEKRYADKRKENINWLSVAKSYDGIDTNSFDYLCSHSYWHWNWDVSGGCVWHRSGVKGFKLLKAWRQKWEQSF